MKTNMKYILTILMFLICSFSYGQINYQEINKIIKTELASTKKLLANLNKLIKKDPNNVELHKQAVRVKTSIELLENKLAKLKETQNLNKQLLKMNSDFDKRKVKLLHLKELLNISEKELYNLMYQ